MFSYIDFVMIEIHVLGVISNFHPDLSFIMIMNKNFRYNGIERQISLKCNRQMDKHWRWPGAYLMESQTLQYIQVNYLLYDISYRIQFNVIILFFRRMVARIRILFSLKPFATQGKSYMKISAHLGQPLTLVTSACFSVGKTSEGGGII